MRTRIFVFLITFQSLLFGLHWFVYKTWTSFRQAPDPPGISWLAIVVAILSDHVSDGFAARAQISRSSLPACTTRPRRCGSDSSAFSFLPHAPRGSCMASRGSCTSAGRSLISCCVLFGAAILAGLYGMLNSAAHARDANFREAAESPCVVDRARRGARHRYASGPRSRASLRAAHRRHAFAASRRISS